MANTSDEEPLFEAAECDDIEKINKCSLPEAAERDDIEKIKCSLFEAAERGDIESIKCFIEEKAVPASSTNHLGQTLAHIAAKNDNPSLLEYVAEKDLSVLRKLDNDEYSVLHLAVEKGAFDVVKCLVEEHEANITERNRRDLARTAVHTAVEFGHLNLLKYFVEERNADVNTPGEWQDKPPVFLAVQHRRPDILAYLVDERKADLMGVDFFGENILFMAVRADNLTFMKRLLDEMKLKFELDWRNNNGETLVMKAFSLNRINILRYLVDSKRADVNIPEKWNNTTMLHMAASRNDYKVCKYLIAHGANTRFKDKSGKIPVEKATDEHLIEYMLNVSEKMRGRRSVNVAYSASFQPILLAPHQSDTIKDFTRAVSCGGKEGAVVSTFGEIYSSHFRSLFVAIAGSLMRSTHSKLITTGKTLEDKIDPIAMDAVNGIPDFPEY